MAAEADLRRKWLHREPEMGLVLRFVPAAQHEAAVRWGALLAELRETAFELSDPRVTQAKAGWWAEELVRFGQGEARHPLGRELPPGLPWVDLATGMAALAGEEARAADPAQAFARIRPFAESIARAEALWFGGQADPSACTAVAVHLLSQRLLHGRGDDDAARVPMNLMARHGLTPSTLGEERGEPVVRDWSGELLAHAPQPGPAMVVFRRLRSRLDREQLEHLQRHPGRAWQPGPLTVWRAWRLARAG